jgi:hypothetical protein
VNNEDFHEGLLEEREEEREPVRIYIVSRLFTQSVNGVRIEYKKGSIVRDPVQAKTLIDARAPLVEVKDEEDIGVCPHCGLSFSLQAQAGARELTRRARALMPGHV